MTEDRRVRVQTHQDRLARRLIDAVWCIVAALLKEDRVLLSRLRDVRTQLN
jgi:hypothetical protein